MQIKNSKLPLMMFHRRLLMLSNIVISLTKKGIKQGLASNF